MNFLIHSRDFKTTDYKEQFSRAYISSDRKLAAVGTGHYGWCLKVQMIEDFFRLLDEGYNSDVDLNISIERRLESIMKTAADKVCADEVEAGSKSVMALVVAVAEDQFYLLHVGDCRGYLLQQGKLSQLTTDQTVVQKMVEQNKLSPEEARTNPYRKLVTNCLGREYSTIDKISKQVTPGDRLMLCTSGLFDIFDDQEIEKFLVITGDGLENISLPDNSNHVYWSAVTVDCYE
jgi:serine/threonine protein phosphatase PrpC